MPEQRGPQAVITGASAGIGAAYAHALARRGMDLLLTARRVERLDALAQTLRAAHGVDVRLHPADLADPDELERLAGVVAALPRLALLVNNAGFGTGGHFMETTPESQSAMIHVHATAATRLSHAALPALVRAGRGAIINVSSIAAYFKGTTYSASKAYLNSFSAGLQAELRGTGVRVQALCPGYTVTEFHDTPEFADFDRAQVPRAMWMSADAVVDASLTALDRSRHRVVLIPGWRNKLLVASMRLGLRPLVRRMRDRLLRR